MTALAGFLFGVTIAAAWVGWIFWKAYRDNTR